MEAQVKIRNRDRKISFFDYPPTYAADEFDAVTERRPSRVRVICIALAVTAALALLALPALAIPGSTQNPDGSWTAEVSVGGESSLVRIYSISSLLR
jgi:hypothetical protein